MSYLLLVHQIHRDPLEAFQHWWRLFRLCIRIYLLDRTLLEFLLLIYTPSAANLQTYNIRLTEARYRLRLPKLV